MWFVVELVEEVFLVVGEYGIVVGVNVDFWWVGWVQVIVDQDVWLFGYCVVLLVGDDEID